MAMAEGKQDDKEETLTPHCLILPYHFQGHINPMLQFAKRLVQKGLQTTIVLTKYFAKKTPFSSPIIGLETISNGFDDEGPPDLGPELLARSEEFGKRTLREAIQRLADSGRAVDCIIYDPFIPWVPKAAKELGIVSAAFFTQSCAVDRIYQCVCNGELKVPLPDAAEISVPGLPPLLPEDMPSFVHDPGSYPAIFDLLVNQFTTVKDDSWVFVNTFYELEEEVLNHMSRFMRVIAIGPAIPSMFTDKRLLDDKEYGLSIFQPDSAVTMEWLNKQEPESVVYVSVGSYAKLGEDQMEELAWGLELSGKHFLWVVRSSEQSKLPKDFSNLNSDKGLIVSWSPQLDVLAHDAISCFVTHCGWNSTLESLCLGVPLVGVPQWSDQATNAKFVMDVWKTGTRAPAGKNGLVDRETIASCIREVMDGDKGEEMKKNAAKWKELARAAVDEGGSSDKNIQEFVSNLLRSKSRNVVNEENSV